MQLFHSWVVTQGGASAEQESLVPRGFGAVTPA
jgi:hypothetical protein